MKTRYIFSSAILALTAISCTDLDVDIKSQYTELPDSEIATEAQLSNAFYGFRGALGRRFDEGVSCNSDEYTAVSFDGDYLNGRDMANFSLHMIDPDASKNQLNVYNDLQSAITNCNQVIFNLGGEDVDAVAPVRAVRAFYTFLLMELWGDTPIIDHILAEGERIDRTPRAKVAEWIESELLTVRDKCYTEVNPFTYGKPTCWMVDALLAKLYINWNVYTKDVTKSDWNPDAPNAKLDDCIAACDRIINSKHFNLNDDYKIKFMYTNGSQIKDFIYAMPYDAATDTDGLNYARFRTWRRGQEKNGFYSIEMTNSVGGNMVLTPKFVELFCLPGDRRNDVIAGNVGDKISESTFDVYQYDNATGDPTTVRNTYEGTDITFTKDITLASGVDKDGNPQIPNADLNVGANITGWTQGYRSIKFFPDVNDYNIYSRRQDNDVPIFRYADILLTKCEAIVRGGIATGNDTAQSLFNQIRSYVHAPLLDQTPSLGDILDERGREFLDEHWRRNDLIRFGKFEEPWGFKDEYNPNARDPRNRIWPLSVDILNNNTNWTQNCPGFYD